MHESSSFSEKIKILLLSTLGVILLLQIPCPYNFYIVLYTTIVVIAMQQNNNNNNSSSLLPQNSLTQGFRPTGAPVFAPTTPVTTTPFANPSPSNQVRLGLNNGVQVGMSSFNVNTSPPILGQNSQQRGTVVANIPALAAYNNQRI